jgi:hypothetical protein
VRYIENDDVDRLLDAIERCCHSKK